MKCSKPIKTKMGGCFPGQRAVFRGLDLHAALSRSDWVELYTFAITGKRFSTSETRLLHAIWVNTSYPDPRLWNNRVAALAGTSRSTANLAFSAALATSEAAIYGRQIDLAIADFLVRAAEALDQGISLAQIIAEELHHNRSLGGYGRPVARHSADERNSVVIKLADELGLANGRYLRLAHQIENELQQRRLRMRMNFAAVAAALALDLGLSPFQYYMYTFPTFLAGMPGVYIEALELPAGKQFQLPCAALSYHGPKRRPWQTASS